MADQKETQRTFAARWFEEVWNKSRREAIDEMFPKDAVLYDGRVVYRGPEEFKRFYDALREQLSEVRVTVLETISEGNMVCVRWSSTSKQTSTGKQLEVTGMSLLRFEDGHLAEGWQNWDQYGLFQQLEGADSKSFSQTA
ncbi:MAG TPA: ester cyclase [Candidatus Acidoferrum sp.]|nr:ester cyclase [Candidatus Acidoferrum sp.]